jgi:hypothetical protein
MPPLQRSATRLVRSLDADGTGSRLDAALIGNRVSVSADATVTAADSPAALDDFAAALCARWSGEGAAVRAPLDSISIADPSALDGMLIVGDDDPLRVIEELAPIEFAMRRRAGRIEADSVTPAPVDNGVVCDTAVDTNWGAPAGSCAGLQVVRRAERDLTIAGGYGQGVLLAEDDLVLERGATFRGVIVARGTVTLRDASVRGTIVAPHIRLEAGSVTLDRCAIADALAVPESFRAAHPPARSWLPTFE